MNLIIGIQILGMLFAVFMSYLTFLHFRKKEFTTKETIFWLGVWIIFLTISIFPTGLDFIIKNWLSFNRRLDFFIVIGFMFVIGVIFYIYTIIRKVQNKVENLVRKIALEKK